MNGVVTPALRREVAAFFVMHTGPVDAEIVDYVAALIAEDERGEAREEVMDTIVEFCQQFAELSRSTQDAHVSSLLQRVRAVGAAAVQTTGRPMAPDAAKALGRLDSLSISGNGGSDDTTTTSNSAAAPCSDDSEAPAAAASSQEREALSTLRAICPRPPAEGFLLDVLRRRCSGSVQSAADWLLACVEGGELDVEERSWVAAERRLREERDAAAAASEQARRQIVERYHLQAVAEPRSAAADQGRGLAAWGAGKSSGTGKSAPSATRYRGGAIVSRKGEKFVIEKPPEWDGGSRGRVKSKRKGGVGFY